jgi:hypothetical protein
MNYKICTDLSKEFNPVPKNKRIVDKKLLKDKKGICELCGKKTQTEKHHIKTKRKSEETIQKTIL